MTAKTTPAPTAALFDPRLSARRKARANSGNTQAARGYGEPRGQSGVRSGAFSGYDMADRRGAFRHGEAPVSVAASEAEERMAAEGAAVVAGLTNRSFIKFLVGCKI